MTRKLPKQPSVAKIGGTGPHKPKRVNKDAIIAGLQNDLADSNRKISYLEERVQYIEKQSDKNYAAAIEWRKAGEAARNELTAERDRIRRAEINRSTAQSSLRFAEGFIAASGNWDVYSQATHPKVRTERNDGF